MEDPIAPFIDKAIDAEGLLFGERKRWFFLRLANAVWKFAFATATALQMWFGGAPVIAQARPPIEPQQPYLVSQSQEGPPTEIAQYYVSAPGGSPTVIVPLTGQMMLVGQGVVKVEPPTE